MTNSPATRNRTLHEMCFRTPTGARRSCTATNAATARAARNVGESQIKTEGGSQDETDGRPSDACGGEFPRRGQLLLIDLAFDDAVQTPAHHQPEHDEGSCDGDQRRQRERLQPRGERRHLRSVNDEVGGIRYRQNEAGGIGDQRADQEVRQGRCPRFSDYREYGWREHNGSGVVRQKYRDQSTHGVDDGEESRARAARKVDGFGRDPIEEAFAARQFGEQHHTGEEEVDVRAAAQRRQRVTR